ncbi:MULTISPECIES: hypothetical protein [Exiguobacterium]|uniref:Uncharacterized protein n=1 Tax=Exiguobacterium aestuarii TaxID=273527 RepID=A0ABW2PN23_9BACL|nr:MULTISPECIES: hypothetical protein [Exiguobacterium]MCA0981107.1 hypothetical protein [Exiguobacterium aestuarii]MCT4787282.1 hypothetical protein [Exiguobacterium aestuarii]
MFHYIDPFLWQLVIVPTFTIGLGVAIGLRLRRLSITPLITLLAYLGLEWFMYRGTLFFFTKWWLLPLIALGITFTFIGKRQIDQPSTK